MSGYYDRQGRAITMTEWCDRLRSDQRVAETKTPNGYWVSTVYLGLDHSFGYGPPLIFETMVFPLGPDGQVSSWGELESDRYSTEEEARAGHARLVSVVSEWKPRDVDDGKVEVESPEAGDK